MDSTFQPPIGRREADPGLTERRKTLAATRLESEPTLKKRIDAHFTAFDSSLNLLALDHQAVADRAGFDLTGDTRYAATWQLAGRSIGLSRGLVALLRSRCCAESLALARTLHECNRLLDALSHPQVGDELLAKWLADDGNKYVRPWETRAAEKAIDEWIEKRMQDAGDTPTKPTAPLSDSLYDHLSWTGHNRRRAIQEFVDEETQTMIVGPHPDPRVWAAYTLYGSRLIEETVISVCFALARFIGQDYVGKRQLPLQAELERVRSSQPLAASGSNPDESAAS